MKKYQPELEEETLKEPNNIFYLVVFRGFYIGQQRIMASLSALMRFVENNPDADFDVFYVDTLALEIAPYDIAPLLSLRKPKRRKT